MSELLPCPFCWNAAHVVRSFQYGQNRYGVECADCFGSVTPILPTEAAAAEAWNTRAERTCEAVVDSQNGLVCSECGSSALVRDWAEMHSWGGGYERVRFATYDYCPNCGAKAVNNDN